MTALRVLDAETARTVEAVCDAIVPGSARVRPAVYVDALLARMEQAPRAAALAAFAVPGRRATSREHVGTPEFLQVRALAIEAFYSDFVAPGVEATGAWAEIDFNTPLATRLAKDWSYLGIAMSERFDVVVVGSGAGGGVVAGELAERGRDVLLLECGPHRTAADFTRWEAKATHDLWWPIRFALIDGGAGGAVALARRPLRRRHDDDQHEGRAARRTTTTTPSGTRRAGSSGSAARRSARPTSTRTTTASSSGSASASAADWQKSVHTVEPGFRALGVAARAGALVHRRELHELRLVPAGLPDERRQVDAQHVHPRRLGARAGSSCAPARTSSASSIEDGEATGVEYVDGDGTSQRVSTRAPSSSRQGR